MLNDMMLFEKYNNLKGKPLRMMSENELNFIDFSRNLIRE